MQEDSDSTQGPKPTSKPPWLFLIPVVVGLIGFIGYQTVRMGTDTKVAHYQYQVDTSTAAPAVIENGVIKVHAQQNAPQRLANNVRKNDDKKKPDATPSPEGSPSPGPSHEPTPKPSASHESQQVAVKPAPVRRHEKSDDAVSRMPVPHIERPIAGRMVANVSANQPQSGNNDSNNAPMDVPANRTGHAAQAQAPAAAVAAPAPAATAKSVEVAVAAAPAVIDAADHVVDAKMSYAAAPDYPSIARDQGLSGTSVVFVTVDHDGSILHMSIASSSGSSTLDRAALSAARSSRYVAPKVDGKPATETYRVTYEFSPN